MKSIFIFNSGLSLVSKRGDRKGSELKINRNLFGSLFDLFLSLHPLISFIHLNLNAYENKIMQKMCKIGPNAW